MFATAVEFLGLECRMEDDVGHEIEPEIQVFLDDVERDGGCVLACLRRQLATDKIDCVSDVLSRAPLGSLRQEVCGHLRHAWTSCRVVDASRRENDKPRGNGGFAAVADDENFQTIRKSLRGRGRKVIGRRSARAGHLWVEFCAGRDDAGAVLLVFLILLRGGMLFCGWRGCLLGEHRSARETDQGE